jgi:hypothetical protein
MRLVLLLSLVGLLAVNGYSQKAKTKRPVKPAKKVAAKAPTIATTLDLTQLADGQAVALDTARGTLAATDAVNQNGEGQKRYFDRYTLTLRQGDLLLVEYASEAYRVMLGLEPPGSGGRAVFGYDSTKFENVLSKHLFQFPVPVTGTYTLLLTSADPQKTGSYRVRKFILPGTSVMPLATADFCQKLTFLLAQSQLNFDRLVGKKTKTDKKTGLVETYQSKYEFVPGKTTEIVRDYDLDKTKLNATLAEFTKKEDALKALDTYAAQLKACTPGYQYETLEGEAFKEISAATYADFVSVTMRILGKKKFAVVLGVD